MKAIAVVGPTAAGKSEVALEIARQMSGEVVSVDSMQVYRGMDIGTAKATPEMRSSVPHHMVDIRDPDDDMSVAEFQAEGLRMLERLETAGRVPVICGGSGLHFRSLVDPLRFPPSDPVVRAELEALSENAARRRLLALDPQASEHIDLANPRRVVRALEIAVVADLVPSVRARTAEAQAIRDYEPRLPVVILGIDCGSELGRRVEQRFDRMLEAGLVEEVRQLRPRLGKLASQAVGYKELLPVVDDAVDLETGRSNAIQATRALAKRQRTFFRRDPRVIWVPWSPNSDELVAAALACLDGQV